MAERIALRGVRQLAKDEGYEAEAVPNRRKTSFYTRISRNGVVLTLAGVIHPDELARRAEYRNTMAKKTQGLLFPDLEKERVASSGLSDSEDVANDVVEGTVYALLTYGPRDKKSPTFIVLSIPDGDCKTAVAEKSFSYMINDKDKVAAVHIRTTQASPENSDWAAEERIPEGPLVSLKNEAKTEKNEDE